MLSVMVSILSSQSFAYGEDELEYYGFNEPVSVSLLSLDLPESGLVIGDTPPENPLFYGSGWVTGTDSELGRVTVYFPLSSKEDVWGVDRNGYLYNISSSSVTGYLSGVYNNSVTASGFSYPRYREGSGSSYNYVDLHLVPSDSNLHIRTQMEPLYTLDDLIPYFVVCMLGVLLVCSMRR